MTQVLRGLDLITTGYTVFEKDQVLTEAQLNSVAEYFDDQTRLTRVQLLGVGIVCGLRPALAGDRVRVTKGVGVTTDGDLLTLTADTTYKGFKAYGADAPAYGPFYSDGSMVPAYELVAEGVDDARATDLSQFGASTGKTLSDMLVVLLMESYQHDPDLCSGTDCDNLGKDSVHTTKLLLIDQSAASRLAENIPNPRSVAAQLQPVVADRAAVPPATATTLAAATTTTPPAPAVTTPAMLAACYRAACNSMHTNIRNALTNLYNVGSTLLADAFPNAVAGWTGPLDTVHETFQTNDAGIQYYYDFLKDLVETYNELRWFLFEDTTVCCPNIQAFPKHLVLGGVVSGTSLNQFRTGLYPSPLVSATVERWWYAKWLAGKLNGLVHAFEIPSGMFPIRITPSRSEESRLETRAIPFYYKTSESPPIQQIWNFGLARRGMGAFNYSYNAAAYGAQGGAASPFAAQIGPLPFFRIEGHLGQKVSDVMTALENEIHGRQLPIALRAVLVHEDKRKIVVHAPPRASDLYHMHHLIKHAIASQLTDLAKFAENLKSEVNRAISEQEFTNPPNVDAVSQVQTLAFNKNASVQNSAQYAMTKLAASQSEWIDDANSAVTAAAEFKMQLGDLATTQILGPVDVAIAMPHAPWVNWLGDIIKDVSDKEDTKLLFAQFVERHPGIEHFAGVVRGGTFILAYDDSGVVVADFMLPYYLELPEPPAVEPTLDLPKLDPPWFQKPDIRIRNPIDRFRDDRINVLERQIQSQLDKYGVLVDVMKGVPGAEVVKPPSGSGPFTDPVLEGYVKDIDRKATTLEDLQIKVSELGVDPAVLKKQIEAAEEDVAQATVTASKYVAQSGMPVTKGTDGYVAMTKVAQSTGRLTNTTVVKNMTLGLQEAATGARNPDAANVLRNIAQTRGGMP